MSTQQIEAPEGYRNLAKGERYHVVSLVHVESRVLLVHFSAARIGNTKKKGKKRRRESRHQAQLHKMVRCDFEQGLLDGHIRKVKDPASLPPWLSSLEAVDIEALDTRRAISIARRLGAGPGSSDETADDKCFRTHSRRIDDREALLAHAIDDLDTILAADDPEALLNRYARSCPVPQNETRFRVMFWTKVCFPWSRWALLGSYCRIGRWDRAAPEHLGKKFGRPAKSLGKHYGSPGCDPVFIQKVQESYLRHAAIGVPFLEVYRKALRVDFGCLSRRNEKGYQVLYQPQGKPFPTEHQFRYRIEKMIGRRQMQINVWGAERVRQKIAESQGRYSEAVANFMERTALDATHIKEVPRGLQEGSQLPQLIQASEADEATSVITGVGFTLGSEKGSAYRAALFCDAINKKKYCKLFGLEIEEEDWPTQGLSPNYRTDRGPGSKSQKTGDADHQPAFQKLTPSYSPISNSTIESAHKRTVKLEGAPTYVVSSLTPVQMVKRALTEVIKQNKGRNVTEKLTPEMLIDGVPGTPLGIWKYLDDRMRTCAQQIPFESAVRMFLEPVEFIIKDGFVWLHGQRFRAQELRDWLPTTTKKTVKGYVLELCVRYAWIEVGKRIIEVEAVLPLRDDTSQLFVSLTELQQLGELKVKAQTNAAINAHAASVESMARQEEETGYFDGGEKRRFGRKKPHSKKARESAKDFDLA
jgi:hypothetical protein